MGAIRDPYSDALLSNGKPTKFKATIPTCPERNKESKKEERGVRFIQLISSGEDFSKSVPVPYLRVCVEFIRMALMDYQLDRVSHSVDMYAFELPSLMLRALIAVKGKIAKSHEPR